LTGADSESFILPSSFPFPFFFRIADHVSGRQNFRLSPSLGVSDWKIGVFDRMRNFSFFLPLFSPSFFHQDEMAVDVYQGLIFSPTKVALEPACEKP